MDMLDTMLSRRSIRKYKDEPVCPAILWNDSRAQPPPARAKGPGSSS